VEQRWVFPTDSSLCANSAHAAEGVVMADDARSSPSLEGAEGHPAWMICEVVHKLH